MSCVRERINYLVDGIHAIKWVLGEARVKGIILVAWSGVSCDAKIIILKDPNWVIHDELSARAAALHGELTIIRRVRKSGNLNESTGGYDRRKRPRVCRIPPRCRSDCAQRVVYGRYMAAVGAGAGAGNGTAHIVVLQE